MSKSLLVDFSSWLCAVFHPSVISLILLLGLLLSLSFGLQKDFLNQIVVFLLIILQFKSKNTQWSKTLLSLIGPGDALDYVLRNVFSEASGARNGLPKVLVIITDGKSEDPVASYAKQLRSTGVEIFVLGMQPEQFYCTPHYIFYSYLMLLAGVCNKSNLWWRSNGRRLNSYIVNLQASDSRFYMCLCSSFAQTFHKLRRRNTTGMLLWS